MSEPLADEHLRRKYHSTLFESAISLKADSKPPLPESFQLPSETNSPTQGAGGEKSNYARTGNVPAHVAK